MTRVVFFGTESESVLVLKKLTENDFNVIAVVTKPDSPRGRGRKFDSPAVKKLANEQGIPVFQPTKLSADNLPRADVGILVSYGKIIPQAIIDIFPHGIINIHPSLLPKYRGPSPIETAIVNGDDETGVTLMSLDAKMDAGSIYAQEKVALSSTETSPKLYEELFNLGADLLIKNFDKIISGELKPAAQDDSLATYCRLLTKSDGILKPSRMTATECERKVRAYQKFPRTRIIFMDRETIITKAHTAESESPEGVRCTDGKWLIIDELMSPTSGKQMCTIDYLNGLK